MPNFRGSTYFVNIGPLPSKQMAIKLNCYVLFYTMIPMKTLNPYFTFQDFFLVTAIYLYIKFTQKKGKFIIYIHRPKGTFSHKKYHHWPNRGFYQSNGSCENNYFNPLIFMQIPQSLLNICIERTAEIDNKSKWIINYGAIPLNRNTISVKTLITLIL